MGVVVHMAVSQGLNQELTKKMAEYKVYEEETSALEGQYSLVLTSIQDMNRALTSLKAIKEAEDGDEVLVPIGGGVFVPFRMFKAPPLIMNLGGGASMECTAEDAIKSIEEKLESLNKTKANLEQTLRDLTSKMERVSSEIEDMYASGGHQ